MTLVLFDIDGTLLLTGGLGTECMTAALAELSGRAIDPGRVSFPGNLDPILFRELCQTHGIDPSARTQRAFRAAYARLLAERLRAERTRTRALPGVIELIGALRATPGLTLGILTGNYPETGRLKIAAAGLDPEDFPVAAWGDDGSRRRDLPGVALRRQAARTGSAPAPGEVVIVGDTPRDVDCALAAGCRALAVATGRFGLAELAASGAHAVLRDLSDTQAVMEWLN